MSNHDVVANLLDGDILVSEFELQSFTFTFGLILLGKERTLLSPQL